MSSYFDKAEREAAESIEDAKAIEAAVIADVNLITGDREFPDDLRQKIQKAIALLRIESVNGATKGKEWYESLGNSKLLSTLHSLFHEVAQARIETRFGILNDRPSSILSMRDEYTKEKEESPV